MPYQGRPVPNPGGEDFRGWLEEEFRRVAQLTCEVNVLRLTNTFEAPAKPRDGNIIFTDATGFNPGGGAGFYGWRAGAWRKLDV
jgi:hypothetical protein